MWHTMSKISNTCSYTYYMRRGSSW